MTGGPSLPQERRLVTSIPGPGSLERLDFNDLEGDKIVLEVDLAAGAGRDDFLVRHPLTTRALIDIGVDCTGCDPADVLRRVESEVAGSELRGAVVRVRLASLQRDVYHALDFARLDALFEACLHHSVSVGREGLRVDTQLEASELAFGPFARSRVPAGLDAERVIALAQNFLDAAAAEEAEKEATA